ncbi:hypothetical protein SM22010_15380 [Xanthomonas hortorum pv. gardneri]|nr:hypothetical protein SM17710_09665 [Xanthomonas hortorum pv. gardneri]KLB08675.1 hypothetical protein SM22010_15380 [Xanthomonas hortorum pv. gardneri]KLB15390.1 hypothetical protein SM41311_21275 [Xanthomonas hortorum pv. gardneri]
MISDSMAIVSRICCALFRGSLAAETCRIFISHISVEMAPVLLRLLHRFKYHRLESACTQKK